MIAASPVRRVYYSEQTGYSVVVYKTSDPIPEQAVSEYCGTMPCFKAAGQQLPDTEGLLAELDGEWKENRYGWQMQVRMFRTFLPKTREGMIGYLSSGLVKGIGPVTAGRIVEQFGEDTFQIMEQEPDRLLEIRGITLAKLGEIRSTFQESSRIRELMAYLAPYQVSANRVRKIQERFGEKAVDILKENPYRLTEVAGMGFLTVDAVARKMEGLQPDSPVRLQAVLEHVLKQAALSGHLYLQAGEAVQQAGILLGRLQTPVEEKKIRDAGNRMVKEGILEAFDGGIYLKGNCRDEAAAAKEVVRLLEADLPSVDAGEVLEKAQKLDGISLGEKQKEAVLNAFKSPVSIITGGPGRGKTTVLRTLLRIFKMLCPQEDVLLAAPTGRAARRMAESTGYAAMTIHRALGLTDDGEELQDTGMIGESLIIVDEMTMVDMFLAARLLERIPEKSRVILVGDADQLPSVGPGNVFRELIFCKKIPVTVLDVSYRQKDKQLLLENAERINAGNTRLKFGKEFRFIRTDSPEQAADCIAAFMMDPAGVLMELTGNYEEGLGMQEGFEKLLAEAYRAGKREAETQKDFVMVESELVQGCRRPSVIEIQEPTVVGRAGVLVKLNSLLDNCAAVTLADGEVVRRNPDTVIIMTTNTAYNGCRPMNQSVLSRLNLLIDEENLTEKEMAERAGIRTGCRDKKGLLNMAKLLNGLKKNYADVIAAGGICGYREYEDWVRAWMESGDMGGELKSTVISKMTDQAEIQNEILASARMMMKCPVA